MKNLGGSTMLLLVVGVALAGLSADVLARQAPDLSGRWTREATTGTTATPGPKAWPPQMEMTQAGVDLTVQPASGKPQQGCVQGLIMGILSTSAAA